ncbi:MAG: glutathione S-transferase family protein [Gammaproteobacteria bacterium]|nr:glutathione S-transferase family protein [Gammaproteobacteria bacterium]
MRLFDFDRAPNPRRVRFFMAEKGIVIPRVNVDLYRHEQLSQEFLAINPAGTVPVLETDDGTYLAESLAICRYLEALHPQPPLFGATPREEALTLMWANIVENDGLLAVAEVLRNLSPGFRNHVLPGPHPYPQIPALVDRGRQRAGQFFDRVGQQLLHQQYLAGDGFSFADISLLVTVDFAGWVDINPMRTRPSLERWYRQVAARPGAQA